MLRQGFLVYPFYRTSLQHRQGHISRFLLPLLDEQANLVEKHQVDTLLLCPDPRSYALEGFLVIQEALQILSFSARDAADKWRAPS